MTKQIHLQNVGISIKNRVLFDHFTFDLCEGSNVCLIGSEGVGKTSLLRAILGQITYHGEILKEATCRGVLKDNLKDDISIIDYLHLDQLDEETKQEMQTFLDLKSLLYPVNKLTKKYQIKVLILEQVLQNPRFLFLDDILFDFSNREKKELFSFLQKREITTFYVTSNLEDALLFSYILVMGHEGILMEGSAMAVLKEEKILKRLGFSLPFFLDLSLQLKSYDLIHDIYLNPKELTENLWKFN